MTFSLSNILVITIFRIINYGLTALFTYMNSILCPLVINAIFAPFHTKTQQNTEICVFACQFILFYIVEYTNTGW